MTKHYIFRLRVGAPSTPAQASQLAAWLDNIAARGGELVCFHPGAGIAETIAVIRTADAAALRDLDNWDQALPES
jgi:hypothetical protein